METESTPTESYHVMIQEIVNILDQTNPPEQEYLLHMDHPGMGGPLQKEVILWRRYGKKTDEVLQSIRTFDWKNGTLTEEHEKAATFARYLALANDKLSVEKQEVNDNGDLVTTFKREVPLHIIGMIYNQAGIVGVETIPNSQEK